MADPLAGCSSVDPCEYTIEYDEELDFNSPNFNPERALYSPNVSVPFPEIKSFKSVKHYEDAIKSRAKPKLASENKDKSKENVEAHVDKPHKTESASQRKTQHGKDVKASSRDSSKSCDKQLAASSVDKRVEGQGQLPCDRSRDGSTQRSTADTTEEQALDLSLKTTTVLTPPMASSSGSGWSSGPSSQRSYENPSNKSSAKSEEKQQTSAADKKPLSIQGKTLNISWRSTESTKDHETERKSHAATRSDHSSPKPLKHPVVPTLPTKYENSPDRFKNPERHTSHLSKSSKHLRVSSSTNEKRSHSSSPYHAQKQHFESPSPRRHDKLSRDTHVLSRFNEKSPNTSGRSQERPHHASQSSSGTLAKSESTSWRNPERPLHSSGGRIDRPVERPLHSLGGRIDRPIERSLDSLGGRNDRPVERSLDSLGGRNDRPIERPLHSLGERIDRPIERSLHSLGGRIDRPSTFSASSERQEAVSDSHKERRHSEMKLSHQTLSPRVDTSRLQKTPNLNYKKEITQQVEIPPSEATASSASRKSNRKSEIRNVFSRMERMAGPLRVLTRCVQEHLQVRVMTRGAVAVKSICRGYIVAFDKHFNMALVDVDEIYRRPAALGKIKSKRSKKLLAAQKTLQQEREEYVAKWNSEQSIKGASSSLQDLSLQAESSKDQKFSSDVSKHQQETLTGGADPLFSQSKQTHEPLSKSSQFFPRHSSTQGGQTVLLQQPGSVEAGVPDQFKLLSKSAQAKLRRIQSVYEDHIVPLSPFEREALILGIADENVMHRHINQMLLRGENVVSVSIIEDF